MMAASNDTSHIEVGTASTRNLIITTTAFTNLCIVFVLIAAASKIKPHIKITLLNLLASDMLGMVSIMGYTLYAQSRAPSHHYSCLLSMYFTSNGYILSHAAVTGISLHNFVAVTYPFKHKVYFTTTTILATTIVLWVGVFLLTVPCIMIGYPKQEPCVVLATIPHHGIVTIFILNTVLDGSVIVMNIKMCLLIKTRRKIASINIAPSKASNSKAKSNEQHPGRFYDMEEQNVQAVNSATLPMRSLCLSKVERDSQADDADCKNISNAKFNEQYTNDLSRSEASNYNENNVRQMSAPNLDHFTVPLTENAYDLSFIMRLGSSNSLVSELSFEQGDHEYHQMNDLIQCRDKTYTEHHSRKKNHSDNQYLDTILPNQTSNFLSPPSRIDFLSKAMLKNSPRSVSHQLSTSKVVSQPSIDSAVYSLQSAPPSTIFFTDSSDIAASSARHARRNELGLIKKGSIQSLTDIQRKAKSKSSQSKRISTSMAIISVWCLIFNVPSTIYMFYFAFLASDRVSTNYSTLGVISTSVILVNVLGDPFIYAWRFVPWRHLYRRIKNRWFTRIVR